MSNTATPQAKQFTEPGVTIVQGDALALDGKRTEALWSNRPLARELSLFEGIV